MSDTPPRRTRRQPPKRGTPSLPFIPIFIVVIVLGFAIGAALSILGRNNEQRETASVATPAQQTLEPVTPAPTEVPTPEPTTPPATAEPSASPAPRPSPSPLRTRAAATPTHRATSPPASTAPAAAAASAAPSESAPSAAVEPSSAPSPPPAPSRAPAAAPVRAAPVSSSSPTNAPASTDQTDGEFGKQAANVVRGYIAAVSHGDISGAYDALGQTVPANADLPEIGVIDGSTRIRHLETHGSRDAVAVDVDMQTSAGLYLGQYTVHRTSSGGAVIVQHSIIKP